MSNVDVKIKEEAVICLLNMTSLMRMYCNQNKLQQDEIEINLEKLIFKNNIFSYLAQSVLDKSEAGTFKNSETVSSGMSIIENIFYISDQIGLTAETRGLYE